ncbi:hypothetical protein [uncultured Sphingomonas sp.]|uniref:hypothetical protein n=1 Tax=uncultured Sphingomonas sp. TaxID=158754 RepID=UPI0025F1C8C6|nr:hypothetical protein [uncultured Sphingomonas sp.]
MRTNRDRAILASSSMLVLGVALVAPPVLAQDTTIANSVTTGTTWSGVTAPGSNFTITSAGTINTADPNAITITGTVGSTLGTLANSGSVVDTFATGTAISIGTVSVAEIVNNLTGTISAARTGIMLGSAGTIGVLTNAGRISGRTAITNSGSIGSLSNTGVIAGTTRGIQNAVTGRIGTLNNSGTITVAAGAAGAAGGIANNGGSILTLINTGTIISSSSSGIGNNQTSSSIGQITNSGLISGATGGLWNSGTMSQVTNTGRIIGAQAGVFHASGTIGTIDNSGTISGGSYGISIGAGAFNSLINSGTVSGAIALYLASGVTVPNITNSGVIAGTINNRSANALTISGGTGATFGTLTGSTLTNKGSIISTLANLEFASGNLVLNDNINATGRTVSNSGANLVLNSIINVVGAYTQTAGTLTVDPLGGVIATGAVTASGGTIRSTFVSTGNYLAGTYTLLGGSSLNLTGANVTIGNLTGLSRSSITSGTALQLLVNNDYVGGTLASASNAGTLTSANTGLYVATTGSIGTFSNTGTLSGSQFGVNNRGTIGLLSNSGRITNTNFTALWNQGSIGQLVNTGTITNSSWAILNTGTIGTITNSGVIAGAGNAIQNNAVINLLDNSGTMSGASNAVAGTFGTVANSGLILGNINGFGGSIGTIIGGSNGTVGTFTGYNGVSQGTIGASGNLNFASGALLLNDSIIAAGTSAALLTISNTGADITLSTIVNVNANFSQSAGTLNLGNAGKLAVTQAATFTGGTILAGANGFSSTSTYLKGAIGGTLVSGGAGSSYAGLSIAASGGFTGLAFGSATSGNNLLLSANNIYVGDTQASISNSDSISGTTWALYVANTGAIGTLVNSGTLTGLNDGLSSNGSIGSLSNSGLISGAQKGLGNQSTITNLVNTATGTILGGTAAGLQNDTSMGTVTNAGLISSGSAGFANYGTLGLLSNSGSINGGPQGIYLDGNSNTGAINNSGTITSGQSAVQVSGTLGSLVNSGYIGNATNAVNVAGTLATLVNANGGTLSGNNVVYISGSLGGLSNSGVIKGRIDNQTANNLTITGGAAGTIGTLTGTSGIGTINNTLSNVVFASGNLLLNDRIIATSRTVSNTGASLSLTSNISITGNYSQSAGTLSLTPGTSSLIVSGAANLSGGTVLANLSSTGNYLASNYTLVSGGASSSLSGATVSAGSITGLASSSTISGNNLLLTIANDYVGGSLATLANAASLTSAATGLYVATTGTIGTVSNTGTLGGMQFGVNNRGTIGTLSNAGRITNANFTALWNQGSIGQLVNTGTITNSSWAILNSGTIGTVTNSGVITGAGVAIQNNAVVAVVNNSGTMSGQTALAGTFGTVINTGLIRGNINASGGVIGTIIGGSGGTIGTFTGATGTTQGTIGAGGNLIFAAGALLLNDSITAVNIAASALTVSNTGADITLSTIVNVNGNFSQSAGTLNLGSTGRLIVTQAASITGGTIAVSGLSSTGNYIAGTNAGTLVSGGAGSNYTGASISLSGVYGLIAAATTSGTNLVLGISNDYVGGTLATLDNSGSIGGVANAVYIAATGDVGTLSNSGTLSGTDSGVFNAGQVALLSNAGLIEGGNPGLSNAATGRITALVNTGTIKTTNDAFGTGLQNAGSIGTLTNSGLIGNNLGIFNNGGTIAQLDNQGTVAGATALFTTGSVGTFSNSGAISTSGNAINVWSGTLGSLVNAGTMSGASGALLISVNGSVGGVTNRGVIRGAIVNNSANDLTIAGGSGSTIGTITGVSGQTSIVNAASDLVFSGGNLALNAAIDVTGHSVLNTGAALTLPGMVSITGNYTQSSGSLILDPGVGGLAVSGVATLSGGSVVAALSSSGTYLAGTSYTLIQGGVGSSYSGASFASTGVSGLGVTTSVATIGGNTNLLLSVTNDYIGSSQSSLVNTGTLSTATAVYVASGATLGVLSNSGTLTGSANGVLAQGTIGTVSNSGLIQGPNALVALGGIGVVMNSGAVLGDVRNQSASAMTLIGGTSGYGTFSGQGGAQGTITSTGADVLLASGRILLDDAVVVTGHSLTNSGATVRLDRAVNVTGNFSQTGGTLQLTAGTDALIVSGTAALSGGTIALDGFSATGNYLAGAGAGTLVQGGVGSSYGGLTYTANVTGLEVGGATQGTNLVAQIANDYVGGTLAALNNTSALNAMTAIYVAGTGSIGTLTNSDTVTGTTGLANNGTIGAIANSGTISASMAIFNTGVLGTIANSGVIAGNITNIGAQDLVFVGGPGGAFGTLTGQGGSQGTITNSGGNVVLASGGIVLNDAVQLGSGTLVNGGATVQLVNNVAVTGNYSQASGTLALGMASLQVSGIASISGGLITTNQLDSTANYLAGSGAGTLVRGGAGSSYAGVGVASGVSGLALTTSVGTIGGNVDLMLATRNDYVGGTLADLNNTGTISGVSTAVYVASSGSIGTLSNSGTLAGSEYGVSNRGAIGQIANSGTLSGSVAAIYNAGTLGPITNSGVIAGNIQSVAVQGLTISGGSGSSIGTLTGVNGGRGTISNSGGAVVFAGGNLLLGDDVVAGSVANSGAALTLATSANVTGAFSQTAGKLALATGAQLNVSGAATLSGGTVSTTLPGAANYLAGTTAATLVTGGTGSNYAGVSVTTGAIPGLALSSSTSGTNLVVTAANNYIGAGLASLTNSGSLTADYPVYVAATGSLGSLTNSGTLSGSVAAIYNAGTLGPITNSGVIAGNIQNVSSTDLRIAGGSGTSFGTLTGFGAGSQGTITNLASNLVLSGNLLLNDAINLGTRGLVSTAALQLNNVVRVAGNYSQTGGALLIGVTSTSVYGQLQVSGSASLTGTNVRLIALGGTSLSAGSAFTVVKAGGALTYSGLTALISGFDGSFSTATGGGTSDLVLTVLNNVPATQFAPTGVSAGGPGVGTGAALDAIVAAGNGPGSAAALPVINEVLVPLAALPVAEQERAIVQLSPTQLTPQVMAIAVSPAVNAIVQHQEVLAANASGREERGMAAGSQGQRGGVWGQVLVNAAKRGEASGASPYAANSFGVMAGVDLIGTTNLVVGGALSWVGSTANGRSDLTGSRTRLNSFQGTAYFTWQPGDPETSGLAIDGQLGFGYNHYRQQRRIDYLGRTAEASYNGKQYLGGLRVSYTVPLSDTASLTPFAGARVIHLDNDGYTESGAGTANMQVRKLSVDSFNHEVGVQGAAIFDTASGRFAPSLKIGWTHSYKNSPIPLSAVLGGVAFTSTSTRGPRDGALIGAGVSFMRTDRLRIGVQYDGELRNAFQSHSGTVKLTVNF